MLLLLPALGQLRRLHTPSLPLPPPPPPPKATPSLPAERRYPSDGQAGTPPPGSVSRRNMDGSHYSPNVINAPSTYPRSQNTPTHTLPPLQQLLSTTLSQAYSYAHAPRSPATPNTPGSATSNSIGSYPPPPSNNGGRGSFQMMPNTSYPPPHQTYTSSALMPQTTGAM